MGGKYYMHVIWRKWVQLSSVIWRGRWDNRETCRREKPNVEILLYQEVKFWVQVCEFDVGLASELSHIFHKCQAHFHLGNISIQTVPFTLFFGCCQKTVISLFFGNTQQLATLYYGTNHSFVVFILSWTGLNLLSSDNGCRNKLVCRENNLMRILPWQISQACCCWWGSSVILTRLVFWTWIRSSFQNFAPMRYICGTALTALRACKGE